MSKNKFRSAALLAGCFIFIAFALLIAGTYSYAEGEERQRETISYTLSDEEKEVVSVSMPEITTAYFAETNLPVLYLTTEGGAPISSNKVYTEGYLTNPDGKELPCKFRGRGNASWTTYPQKSYLLKFEEKVSLLGMRPSRKWVLRSNYGDQALVRDAVATDLAFSMDHLEFTAETYSVDVVLNGRYIGVYQLAEKVEVGFGKVDLFSREEEYPFDETKCITYGEYVAGQTYEKAPEDTAFLMETSFDFYDSHVYGLEYFKVGHLPSTFVTYPEPIPENAADITAAMDYMALVDAAIVSGENIAEYIDLDSFADWFIVMELTFNTDSSFNRSTFLYKRPGGKLKIGPVWDFDHAFGNFKFDEPTYQSWCTGEAVYAMCQHHWPDYLLNNDVFMEHVQKRFDEKKEALAAIIETSVFSHMEWVQASGEYQSMCYNVALDTDPENLTGFLKNRLAWMDNSLHSDNYNRHPATYSINWDPPEQKEETVTEETTVVIDENGE